jgi:hypothetical protein
MSGDWLRQAPHELAYTRRARLVVEALDPVTLDLVGPGLRISVDGLDARPVLSSGGRHVWFDERGRTPKTLHINPGALPYLRVDRAVDPLPPPPAPPAKPQTCTLMRIELAPSIAYPFAPGITAYRGSFIVDAADDPPVGLADAEVRMQWIDDSQAGEVWVDAPNRSRTSANGDFVALVRLGPSQIARADAQHRMRVRVVATHAGTTRMTPELQILFNRLTDAPSSFVWSAL